jgi:hypothetical protein
MIAGIPENGRIWVELSKRERAIKALSLFFYISEKCTTSSLKASLTA